MGTNSLINASELDFDAIKTNFKNFMAGQSKFSDYNFDGSGLSVLLDSLAYNTHYRGLYDNMMLNETFLDSASIRGNIVSRAKELGYTPNSAICATAIVTINISGIVGGPQTIVIPRLTPFQATAGTTTYTFYTNSWYTLNLLNGIYTASNIVLVEGNPASNTYTAVDSTSRYSIPNTGADISTLIVGVQDSATSSAIYTYTNVSTITSVGPADRVFWINETVNGQYEIEFGNGVIGMGIVPGNIVRLDYMTTSNTYRANGIKLFKYNNGPILGAYPSITTTAISNGGSNAESTDSIKFNAPRYYSTQNRAVTASDYTNLIYKLVPEAQSVNTWSGADNIPPVYGKVFICIMPKTTETLTSSQKTIIINDVITSKGVVTITPVIVDPSYLWIEVITNVYYNPRVTTFSANEIALEVQNSILTFNNTQLKRFGAIVRQSQLARLIDNSDSSIVSNVTKVILHREIAPMYDINATYNINLINPIVVDTEQPGVTSTGFRITGSLEEYFLEDNAVGVLHTYYFVSAGVKRYRSESYGTVNYGAGIINIVGLNISAITGTRFMLTIRPISYDVVTALEQIIQIDPTMLQINMNIDTVSLGLGGNSYQFTSSRS